MINTIDHVINIDLANKINMNKSINIKKNDTNSHKFILNIFNNGVAYDLTGSTSRIYFQKSDGTKVFLDCALDIALTGKLSCLLTTQALSYAGLVASEITIYGTAGEILTSVTFNFMVTTVIRDDLAIASTSEFTALTTALNAVDAAVISIPTVEALNIDLQSNIVTGDALDITLNDDITTGNALDITLKGDITTGDALDITLKADISTGNVLDTSLKADIATGNPLDVELKADIATGNPLDVELKADISTGNPLDIALKADIVEGNTTDADLKADIIIAGQNEFATEITNARGGEINLDTRLDKVDTSLADMTTINVKSFGATGDGITDDTLAFKNAIALAQSTKSRLWIPRTEQFYKITDTLAITTQINIESDPLAKLVFTLLAGQSAIKIDHRGNHGSYRFPQIVGNGLGTGLEINSCSLTNIYFPLIDNFETGIHLISSVAKVLDNTIAWNIIGNVTSGVKLETVSSLYSMEGNLFKFNFITGCKYGIHTIRNGEVGVIPYNKFEGVAIHCTIQDGACFYSVGGPISTASFNIQGFVDSNLGTITGGDAVHLATNNFFSANDCTFNLGLESTSLRIIGSNNIIKNRFKPYTQHAEDPAILCSDTNVLSDFNSGIPLGSNITRLKLNIPIKTAPYSGMVYAFHSFCSHGFPKLPAIMYDFTDAPLDYILSVRDISHTVPFLIEIKLNITKTTTIARDVNFFLKFE